MNILLKNVIKIFTDFRKNGKITINYYRVLVVIFILLRIIGFMKDMKKR